MHTLTAWPNMHFGPAFKFLKTGAAFLGEDVPWMVFICICWHAHFMSKTDTRPRQCETNMRCTTRTQHKDNQQPWHRPSHCWKSFASECFFGVNEHRGAHVL